MTGGDGQRGGPPGWPQQPYPQQPYPQQQQSYPQQQQPYPQQPPYPQPPPAEDPQWRLARPGAGAEEMFKDDPFMLDGVKKARAEPDPVQKPWWWFVLQALSGIVGAALGVGVLYGLGWEKDPEPLALLSGLLAGLVTFSGAVGFLPGNYRVIETDRRLTLWKPLGPKIRAALVVGGLLITVAGPLLVIAEEASRQETPAKPRGRGRR